MRTLHRAAFAGALLAAALRPGVARADDAGNCTTLAQAAAAGLAARLAADDQTIQAPQDITTLSCLDGFFNGVGLNVITNLLDPTALLGSVEGKVCAAAQNVWQSYTSGAQCGVTVSGFNVGFGGLGGGTFCPKLTFGGGGPTIGSVGAGLGNGQGGLSLTGTGVPPTGYTLPAGVGY